MILIHFARVSYITFNLIYLCAVTDPELLKQFDL